MTERIADSKDITSAAELQIAKEMDAQAELNAAAYSAEMSAAANLDVAKEKYAADRGSSSMPSDFPEKLAELTAWYKDNPRMPEEIEPILLRRFLKAVDCDVAEAKKVIELNYVMRNKHPQLFMERDPHHEKFHTTRDNNWIAVLPGVTPKGYKVFFHFLTDVEPSMIDNEMEIRATHMVFDTRLRLPDNEDNVDEYDCLANGEIQIIDMRNITFRHMAHSSLSLLRINNKFMRDAAPMCLKGIHMINPPTYIQRMISWARPIIPDEVRKLMFIHGDGLESLYEHVPIDMLPEEYGGKAGKLVDLKDKWKQAVVDNREFLMDPKYWKEKVPAQRSRWAWW